ncbi:MAG: radical SAM family heme chaperone HemW [Muribaculaceae bacterium]|nr:radical SAM family heme chaperone HemW [Muribaculaceae bacterium]
MSGLYIHVPFCKSKCPYCDFYSGPFLASADRYVTAIVDEYAMRRGEVSEPFSTIYIGGGTPSLLTLAQLRTMLDGIRHFGDFDGVVEMTIEANPDDVTTEWVRGVKSLGVNRVSIGVQSLNDDELRAINRRHDSATALRAIDILRKEEIEEISADLIYGLPRQTVESWADSLSRLLSLRLPHFSAYCLQYEPGTRLYAMREKGSVEEASDSVIEQMYGILVENARTAGYHHYEISNFCLEGHHARHNSAYWDLTPYVGLGPSAHSFDGQVRRFNPSNLKKYLNTIESGKVAAVVEDETDVDKFNDYVITALRTAKGIDIGLLSARFPEFLRDRFMANAQTLIDGGRLLADADKIAISPSEIMKSDSIMRELIID